MKKGYKSIEKYTRCRRHIRIVVGDFNAELGPRIGLERFSLGPYTLNESNNRGDWMMQWLMIPELSRAQHHAQQMPDKQTTFRSPKATDKQLDYVLIDRKSLRYSRDAEANDMVHIRSDHR